MFPVLQRLLWFSGWSVISPARLGPLEERWPTSHSHVAHSQATLEASSVICSFLQSCFYFSPPIFTHSIFSLTFCHIFSWFQNTLQVSLSLETLSDSSRLMMCSYPVPPWLPLIFLILWQLTHSTRSNFGGLNQCHIKTIRWVKVKKMQHATGDLKWEVCSRESIHHGYFLYQKCKWFRKCNLLKINFISQCH